MELISVSSLSGGKTSSYMALHYPTDRYVFAVVKTLDKNAAPKDKGLLREAQRRIPDFYASRELDDTLKIILDLEQEIGKPIDWVSSPYTFDELIEKRQMLPNRLTRFCTTELKLTPIFEYCYNIKSLSGMVLMNIGFRFDESQRKTRMMADCQKAYQFRFPFACDFNTRRQSWRTVEWRIPYFPLVENNIEHRHVIDYWDKRGWRFPSVSNCDFCFFHRYHEHQSQIQNHKSRINWWIDQEKKMGKTFLNSHSYEEIKDYRVSIKNTPLFSGALCSCTD